MRPSFLPLLVSAWVLVLGDAARGQTYVENQQEKTKYNLNSARGVPLSDASGTPPGSDGRAPAPGSGSVGSPGQYQAAMPFGGVTVPNSAGLNPSLSLAANAQNVDLPRAAQGGQLRIVLKMSRMGPLIIGRLDTQEFGSMIAPPQTDEYGVLLSLPNATTGRGVVQPEAYWLPEPHSTDNHASDAGFYWSPHLERVFAVGVGPVDVPWVKAVPSVPVGNPAGVTIVQRLGIQYTVLTQRYIVSGNPVKTPRKIYWTHGDYTKTGRPVQVPQARVSDIKVVYNNLVPERVANPVVPSSTVEPDPNRRLDEARTLWFDQTVGSIYAHNVEGRVFVELLGNLRGKDTTARQHIGIEIVDIIREPNPERVTTELGERIPAYGDGSPDDHLLPEAIQDAGMVFAYRHSLGSSERVDFYATRETRNLNDLQMHWLEEGVAGLRWPYRFVRYTLVWPVDAARYSHYVRPLVANENEARTTAVQLPSENAPAIQFQDPLDVTRGKLTDKFQYYTFLTPQQPAHRALLRFSAGENIRFERIFSWLDANLLSGQFGGTVAETLLPWSGGAKPFDQLNDRIVARTFAATVFVGDRISAPPGEAGSGFDPNYLAGHIIAGSFNLYHPGAYRDPLTLGFEAAKAGAIIPVNVMPGRDRLEVLWFREAVLSDVKLREGFKPIHWPAVLGRYTLQWPTAPSEIVLASNDGSGGLPSLQAKGAIYYQNDRSFPGFNPNEEHALMQGGQAYALRDDLNVLSGPEYTSEPHVLVDYVESDGRPALRVFRVLREKPSEGKVFDFAVVAGTVLQPPMPLPLLEVPFAPRLTATPPKSLNREIVTWPVAGSAPGAAGLWTMTLSESHALRTNEMLYLLHPTDPAQSLRFLPSATAPTTLSGFANDTAAYPVTLDLATPGRWRMLTPNLAGLVAGQTAFLYRSDTRHLWRVEVTQVYDGTTAFDLLVPGIPEAELAEASGAAELYLANAAVGSLDQYKNWRLARSRPPSSIANADLRESYTRFTFKDRKGGVWIYRGPHDATENPALTYKFYYRTLPGFFFPSLALNAQPPEGTITPYLRQRDGSGGYHGHPVYGNANNRQTDDGNALGITYRPAWPDQVPVLEMAETLTEPKRGLPAVRGQTSLQILYEQSQVGGGDTHRSVVLHDPTRERQFLLGSGGAASLATLPPSVATSNYRGKTYFPLLPPHLVERFFYDANRGSKGALVLGGQLVKPGLGESYLLLNVLSDTDAGYLKDLCPATDTQNRTAWNLAIDALTTTLETFHENPARPGTYTPNPVLSRTLGPGQIAEVTDDDVAVDSYALSAVGPGTGYVSLVAGNGRAFTPEGDPVSVLILRTVPSLHRGEVSIVESSNPLNERLTLQQIADLAGKAADYRFEWLIAAPVDGLPPSVYQNEHRVLLSGGAWSHVPFPVLSDSPSGTSRIPASRRGADVHGNLVTVDRIPFTGVTRDGDRYVFTVGSPHWLELGVPVVIRSQGGRELLATIVQKTTTSVVVEKDSSQAGSFEAYDVSELYERPDRDGRRSLLFRTFETPGDANYTDVWLSMDLDAAVGGRVYFNGLAVVDLHRGANDTPVGTPPSTFSPLSHAFRLPLSALAGGTRQSGGSLRHTLVVELYSEAQPGATHDFNLRVEAMESTDVTSANWLPLDPVRFPDGVRAVLGGSADVRSLSDNYVIMRYQARSANHVSWVPDPGNAAVNLRWSQWTSPQLAEGWIKRVLRGINPFNQRVTDLFGNQVDTTVSVIAQAGQRWEGDVALNLDSLRNAGLIEIYETVLNRGRMLSLGGGINYGPANDALLLATGYLNDLYMLLGNEAWADAANPTIAISTKDTAIEDFNSIGTALFAFKGQLPTVLEEELALLRGRDDFLLPGVETRPVYNRLVWNYTRGIDAGEVVYSLNYNILDQNADGTLDANDARIMYPQGHGDAYGHYLMALKSYYGLLIDPNFDWVPRIEAVTVLGKPVSVDYQDERKFAAAAAALARAGRQIFDLTWRRDYRPGPGAGWEHLSETRDNTTGRSTVTTRHWGADHWAVRTGQGAYLSWIVGNAIIPDQDPDPSHAGSIQQVDRSTVPELKELPQIVESLQRSMDNAEGGLNPLGLPTDTVPFDLNPLSMLNGVNTTHYEQVYQRAVQALDNAATAFDDAADVTRVLRTQEDSIDDLRTEILMEELAYKNTLIELYGTPYPDDVGPGRTYDTGYDGPDLLHYMYVDEREIRFGGLLDPRSDATWRIDIQTFRPDWLKSARIFDLGGTPQAAAANDRISDFSFIVKARTWPNDGIPDPMTSYLTNSNRYVTYNLSSHGFFAKPQTWSGRRSSPGRIQQSISEIVQARNEAYEAFYWADAAKYDLDWAILSLERKIDSHTSIRDMDVASRALDTGFGAAKLAANIVGMILDATSEQITRVSSAVRESIPKMLIAGLAAGGDLTSGARGALLGAEVGIKSVTDWKKVATGSIVAALEYANEVQKSYLELATTDEQWKQELRDATGEIRDKVYGMQNAFTTINAALQRLDDAQRQYLADVAEGERIQAEREVVRQRAAAVIQGMRSRDAAFRIFRNEKLERYKALFELAAKYAFMAAKAYDYETGLLGTEQGKDFLARIVRSRAVGIFDDYPEFAGSNSGDPGLSGILAELQADYSVVSRRLALKNPDAYGTTASLRQENFRILPGDDGDQAWADLLQAGRRANLLEDSDIRKHCMQIDPGNGLPVPGIVLEFSTTITEGLNLFGKLLAPGDHAFSPAAFATKIFHIGVALEGYKGMDDPLANGSAVAEAGAASPADPSLTFLDPDALAANPYIYLIPVGLDTMRSPPLGDVSRIRTWNVDEVAVPLPFNIGGSDLSEASLWQTPNSLSEPLFTVRKHQPFRPVSSPNVFGTLVVYWTGGEAERTQYANTRLLGRSIWNTKWKLVIPGRTLLNNPEDGLDRLIRSVKDVKFFFSTYSFSGN